MKILNSLFHGILETLGIVFSFEFLVYLIVLADMLFFLHSTKMLSFGYFMTVAFTDPFYILVILMVIVLSILFYFSNFTSGRH